MRDTQSFSAFSGCRWAWSMVLAVCLLLAWGASPALTVHPVAPHVYALVGDLSQRSADNLGNNATFGAVLTDEGVILVDPGGSYQGAARIEAALRGITDKPVVMVINTGGQDHRWLGNGYFRARGARIVASREAVADQRARARDQISALYTLVGEAGMRGTHEVYADQLFDDVVTLNVGGVTLEVHHPGHAHTAGDSYVWLPDSQILFSGDIVYMERMLSVGPHSNSFTWLKSFEALADHRPKHLVPGHGHPTTLAGARADTYEYLKALRAAVGEFMEQGGAIEDIGRIDQSRFAYLRNYEQLKGRNAQRVYEELEWE